MKINKKQLYDELYNCKLEDIDKALTRFMHGKKILSRRKDKPPAQFKY